MSRRARPKFGVLAGWQFYWTPTSLSYLDPIFHGLNAAADALDCDLLFACGIGRSASAGDPRRPAWPFPSASADFAPVGPWNTDGLIVVNPLLDAGRSRDIADLRARGFPVLFIGSGEDGPTLMADSETGIALAMRHLAGHGHRRIAFIAGSPADLSGDSGARLRAYETSIAALGLEADYRLIAHGEHVFDGGAQAMRSVLGTGAAFSAVLASNDESALGAMSALRAAGRNVPGDVAIIGFDDRPQSALEEPGLTSIHVPLFRIGYQACELMRRFVDTGVVEPGPFKVPVRLIGRASCGCPPRIAAGPALTGQAVAAAMAAAAAAADSHLADDRLRALCDGLAAAFSASLASGDATPFTAALEGALAATSRGADGEVDLWQAPLSVLREALPGLAPGEVPRRRGEALLDAARQTVSAAVQRAARSRVIAERDQHNQMGRLTSHLLDALDAGQVFETLTRHLPELGARQAAVALFEEAGEAGPDGWCDVRVLAGAEPTRIRLRNADFPPPALCPPGHPCRLLVIPLNTPRGQAGYLAFDAARMDPYGAVAQQVGAALNSAHLYGEAMAGRRLAEEANRLKSRFLSTVSHELRAPLNLIVGTSQLLLQERSALPARHRADLERIQSSGQQLGWLIRDVLDLASNEAGTLRLATELVDMADALGPVLEIGRQLATDKGLAWSARLPDEPAWVLGDPTRFRQIALNLIQNAVKFTTRGSVGVTVSTEDGWMVTRVNDTGLGIPEAEQGVIFDEFRRADQAAALGIGGLGLGLSISRLLVGRHGGTIGVSSAGIDGEGSTFWFRLPLVDAIRTDPASAPDNRSVVALAGRRADAEALAARLATRGMRAIALVQAEDTAWLTAIARMAPGVIVLDASLAPVQGWEAFRSLKQHPATADIPILFAGAEGRAAVELDYVLKPVITADFERAVEAGGAGLRTVLVVDDDGPTRELHARLAQSRLPACRVITARDGHDALARLEADRPDLVLLDLMMPGLDGFGVLEAMRANPALRDIAVIVITGQTLTEADMNRLNRGVATVLEKAVFSADEMLDRVEAVLDRRRRLAGDAQRLVRRAMAFIHAHYAEPLSRERVARHVGLSEDYLTACFRQELGMTPVTYITRCRLNQARQLLRTTSLTITEIARAAGFSDGSYFSRVFRRATGVAPEAWRRQ